MVKRLRADPAALAPRRYDEQRDAYTKPVGPDYTVRTSRRPGHSIEQLVVQRHRRLSVEIPDVGIGTDHMVEEAVVLVEGDQQRGL